MFYHIVLFNWFPCFWAIQWPNPFMSSLPPAQLVEHGINIASLGLGVQFPLGSPMLTKWYRWFGVFRQLKTFGEIQVPWHVCFQTHRLILIHSPLRLKSLGYKCLPLSHIVQHFQCLLHTPRAGSILRDWWGLEHTIEVGLGQVNFQVAVASSLYKGF